MPETFTITVRREDLEVFLRIIREARYRIVQIIPRDGHVEVQFEK